MIRPGERGTALESLPTVDLLPRARDGSSGALEELFRRYLPRVRAVVRLRLGAGVRSAFDSTDLVQEVLAEAVRLLDRFEDRGQGSFIAWLAQIAQYRIGAHARYLAARPALGAPEPEPHQVGPAADPSPSQDLIQAERTELVEEAVRALPELDRRVVIERAYVGVTWEEVARACELPSPEAARARFSRAKQKLGALLRKLDDEGE